MSLDDIFEFIESFSTSEVTIKTTNYEKRISFKDQKTREYSIYFNVEENGCNITYKPFNKKKFLDIHLINIINKKKFTTVDMVPELIEYIVDIISHHITTFCIICQKKNDIPSDIFITCDQPICEFRYEELIAGDYVTEFFKMDNYITEFMIDSGFAAINHSKCIDIFEPFPSHFLTSNYQPKTEPQFKKGKLSILEGIDLNKYKDFNKLKKIVGEFNKNNFFEICKQYTTDEYLIHEFGKDVYVLIKFILLSCKSQIKKYDFKDDFNLKDKCYKIIQPLDKENEYTKLKEHYKNDSIYVFHGSGNHNWYSIMRNGLKNCSHTKLMTTGAVYGNGIYLSKDIGLSSGYGVVGVFELLNHATYKKTEIIYVCSDENMLIQRYLIIADRRNTSQIKLLNDFFQNIKIV